MDRRQTIAPANWLRMLLLALFASALGAAEPSPVTSVPTDVRERLQLSLYYKKYLNVGGMPIVASGTVSDFALLEARFLIKQMVAYRPSLLTEIARKKVRLAIMAPTEFTTDIPEHSDFTPKEYWDWRARGVGATADRPVFSCGEENLLGYRGNPHANENILIHEFGHVIHEFALSTLDHTFDRWLRDTFELALREGLWAETYAASNYWEYWSVGVQAWFDARDGDNGVNTRAKLKDYDPRLAELLTEVFGDRAWRYVRPSERQSRGSHLASYDVNHAPVFAWPSHLEAARVRYSEGKDMQATPLIKPKAGARIDWRSPSPRGEGSTAILFQNATSGTMQLDWINCEGRAERRFALRPGEKTFCLALPRDVWQVSHEDRIVGYFVAEELPTTATITSSDQPLEN